MALCALPGIPAQPIQNVILPPATSHTLPCLLARRSRRRLADPASQLLQGDADVARVGHARAFIVGWTR